MLTLKKLPRLSLSLLLVAYVIFGKFLTLTTHSQFLWGIAIAWGLFVAIVLMHPLQGLQRMIKRWFKSDTVAFCALVGLAAFASIFLTWFKLFMPIVMMISAEFLARIDLQTSEFTELQACCLLTATAWIGLGVGWMVGQVV
ncbi:hypothetical protein ACKFKF_05370 [Phormidesmis sp. 146-12]